MHDVNPLLLALIGIIVLLVLVVPVLLVWMIGIARHRRAVPPPVPESQ